MSIGVHVYRCTCLYTYQTPMEKRMMTGDIRNCEPKRLGSTMLPTRTWASAGSTIARAADPAGTEESKRQIGRGRRTAVSGPRLGTKVRMYVAMARKRERGKPRRVSTTKLNEANVRQTSDLSTRYLCKH